MPLAQRVLLCSGKHLALLSEGWKETGWLKNIESLDWPETILVKEEIEETIYPRYDDVFFDGVEWLNSL